MWAPGAPGEGEAPPWVGVDGVEFVPPAGETTAMGWDIDPTGLTANEITDRAEAWIEAEMARISPHHYGVSQ